MIAHALENTLPDVSARKGTGFEDILTGQNIPVRPPKGAAHIAMPFMPATDIYRFHMAIAIRDNNPVNMERVLRMYFPDGLSSHPWSGDILLQAVQNAPRGDTRILRQLIGHGAIVNSVGGVRAIVLANLREDLQMASAFSTNGVAHLYVSNRAVLDTIDMIMHERRASAREMAQLLMLFPNLELRGARGHALLHAAENLADSERSSRVRHERTQIAHMLRSHLETGLDQSSDSD